MPTKTTILPTVPNGRTLCREIRILVKVDDINGTAPDYNHHPVTGDLYRELTLRLYKDKAEVLTALMPDTDLTDVWQIFGIV